MYSNQHFFKAHLAVNFFPFQFTASLTTALIVNGLVHSLQSFVKLFYFEENCLAANLLHQLRV